MAEILLHKISFQIAVRPPHKVALEVGSKSSPIIMILDLKMKLIFEFFKE